MPQRSLCLCWGERSAGTGRSSAGQRAWGGGMGRAEAAWLQLSWDEEEEWLSRVSK